MSSKKTTSPYLIIKSSRIHSRGAFARRDIPKNTRIIEYVGEKLTKAKSSKQADVPLERNQKDDKYGAVYIFELNKRYDLDGDVSYNTARLINHSCDPNCESDIIRGKVWIIAIRDIKKGEELTYNYNYDWDDYEDHPCECRTDRCVGYILAEEHWPKLRKKLHRQSRKQLTSKNLSKNHRRSFSNN